MTIELILAILGILSTLTAAVVVVIAAFRVNTAKVWKGEAEAQKERADRLENDLTEIKQRLTQIERKNSRLIEILTALDPARIAAHLSSAED